MWRRVGLMIILRLVWRRAVVLCSVWVRLSWVIVLLVLVRVLVDWRRMRLVGVLMMLLCRLVGLRV